MSKFNVSISLENQSVDIVKEEFKNIFFVNLDDNSLNKYLGLMFDVYDHSTTYKIAQEFLEEEGLEDDIDWPSDLDVQEFSTVLSIFAITKTLGYEYVDVIGDMLAKQLSFNLETRVVVSLGGISTPLAIYDKGELAYMFLNKNKEFLETRYWVPNSFKNK